MERPMTIAELVVSKVLDDVLDSYDFREIKIIFTDDGKSLSVLSANGDKLILEVKTETAEKISGASVISFKEG